ncbi:hypothetical protein ACN4GH_30140, partial [Burkholderia pseudomallei]
MRSAVAVALAVALLGAALLSVERFGAARSRASAAIPASIGARLSGCAFIAVRIGAGRTAPTGDPSGPDG